MAHPEAYLQAAIARATGLKVWPLSAPEGLEPPYIVYRRSGTDRERYLDGSTGGPVAAFEVEVFADFYLAAKDLADLVRLEVDTFKGSESGVTIGSVHLVDERDGDAIYFEGREKPVYSLVQVFHIRWCEKTRSRSKPE